MNLIGSKMIVETMSFEEITKKYDKIHQEMEDRIRGRTDCNAIRRYLIKNKSKKNVWFEQLSFKIDETAIFCAIPFVRDWKEFQKMGNHPYVKVYLIYRTNKGYTILTRGGESDTDYVFFTSHLLDRYRERELQNLSLDKREVIKEFFKENGDICSIDFPTDKLSNNYLGLTSKGVLFGEKIAENIMLYKTYIRKDQLKEHQFEAAIQVEEGLNFLLQYEDQVIMLYDRFLSQRKIMNGEN